MRLVLILGLGFLLSGCGAHVGNIEYIQPPGTKVAKVSASKQVSVATFTDSRDDYPEVSKRIGKLAGGFGETLKSVEIPQPVAIATSDIVYKFLKDAGVNAARTDTNAPDGLTLSGNITHFYCLFFWVHKATIKIDLALADNSTGEKLWEGSIHDHYAGDIFNKYPKAKEGLGLGYDDHAKGINIAMNLMFSEAIAKTWGEGGLRKALEQQIP